MNNNVERQIDIKKYFVYLLKFWWLAVLIAILCGAALGGFKYMKDKKSDEELANKSNWDVEEIEYMENRIEEAKEALDVVERQNVELAVEYYRLIQQYTKYKNSSVYLSQNPYSVNKTTLYYKVDLDVSVKGSFDELQILTDNIVQAYVNYINTGAFSSDVSVNIEDQYVIELVSAEGNDDITCGRNYFKIVIINDNNIEDMRDEIADCVMKYGAAVNDTLAKHSVTLVDEYNSIAADYDLVYDIQVAQTDIYNASTGLAALKKAFTDRQLTCYNDSIAVLDAIEAEQDDINNEDGNGEGARVKVDIQKKYVVIGMFLGLVIYCCIILAKFLFTTCVLAESGFNSMFGLRYLGNLSDCDDDDMIGMIAMKICLACRKDNVQRLAMISSEFLDVSDEGIESLINRLNKENIEVVILEHALADGKSMSELFDIGQCVFVEKTGKTRIAKLSGMVDLCRENAIGMYGVVDLQA